jgi:hypothetical protein
MPEFKMKIAGHTAGVTALFDSTPLYFKAYLTEDAPAFSITVTREDIAFEQQDLLEEALREGFKPRTFTNPFLERQAIGRQFAEFLLEHGTLWLHGSAIALDGRGYLFMARSGTGKSTHTRLWREVFGDRAKMINDDKPFLSLEHGQILLCGAPWSGKHGLHSNICVPLQGICILERGAQNRIWPIAAGDAMPMLLHQSYCPEGAQMQHQALINRLASSVSLWRMTCNRESDAASTAFFAMNGPHS